MTEPQLSAEMEEELQIVIGEALDKIDNQDGSSLISQGNFETAGFILPEVLHFLATALEEQRLSYVEQVEKAKRTLDEQALATIEGHGNPLGAGNEYNQALDDVLAILNGKEQDEK